MPKVLSVVRADVREMLDETTGKFWSNTFIDRWINEGARDIARTAENLVSVGTIPVVAGTASYTPSFNSSILRFHGNMEFVPTGSSQTYPIAPRDRQEMNSIWGTMHGVTSSFPQYYVLDHSQPVVTVTLYPVPSQDGSLNVYYYRLPVEAVADNDNVDVVEGWWDLIEDYAEYKAKRKDNDPSWRDAKSLYDDKLQTMIQNTRAIHDQGHMIVSPNGNGMMSWLYEFTD